jgi:predicted nucleic acid-binding protein
MLLDTSGLLCLLDPDERFHERAVELYNGATFRVTHNYVLAELVALADSRGQPARVALNFVERVMSRPTDVELVWAEEQLTSRALILLKSRTGAGYSLCDAVSFVLMRERGVTDALTLDGHFQQEGFQRLLS